MKRDHQVTEDQEARVRFVWESVVWGAILGCLINIMGERSTDPLTMLEVLLLPVILLVAGAVDGYVTMYRENSFNNLSASERAKQMLNCSLGWTIGFFVFAELVPRIVGVETRLGNFVSELF